MKNSDMSANNNLTFTNSIFNIVLGLKITFNTSWIYNKKEKIHMVYSFNLVVLE